MPTFKNITGLRYGRLFVIRPHDNPRGWRWLCQCDCGKLAVVHGDSLKAGTTRSCGCLNAELTRKRRLSHGLSDSPTYVTWRGMMDRCNNPKNDHFKAYGARGLKCLYSFEAFVAEMGKKPPGHDIHRLDNDKGYESGNCVWLEHAEHIRLHRRHRFSRSAQTDPRIPPTAK